MGEQKFSMKPVVQACEEALVTAGGSGDGQDMRVSTPGGVFHVRWDSRGGATAMGQLPFFAEYLDAAGLFEDWLEGCPLSYAHVGVLRGDGVTPSLLGIVGAGANVLVFGRFGNAGPAGAWDALLVSAGPDCAA